MARPPNDPDADFRRFATTGDPAALARVFDATAPRLLLVARHVARHAADAEDLVQATFVAAMRDPTAWEPRRPVLAWLCGILAHKAGDLARRHARRPADPLGEPDALPDGARAPLDSLLDREAADAIAAALDDLPAAERDVCVLRLVHGLSGVATAHALGRPPATVRTQLRRGLARLRGLLPRSLASPAILALPAERSLAELRRAVLTHLPAGHAAAGSAALTLVSVLVMKKALWTAAALAATAAAVVFWPAAPPRVAPSADPARPPTAGAESTPLDALAAGDAAAATVARQPVDTEPATPRPQGALLTGRVLIQPPSGPDGEPAPPAYPAAGFFVGWQAPRSRDTPAPFVRTDATGRFAIRDEAPQPPRQLRIIAPRPDAPSAEPQGGGGFQTGIVPPPPGGSAWQEEDLGDLLLPEVFSGMTVSLVDAAGRGVEGAFIYLGAPEAPTSRLERSGGLNLRTDASGQARFRGRAASGLWEVQIRDVPPGLVFETGDREFDDHVHFSGTRPELRLQLAPPPDARSVRGIVVDDRGARIANLVVEASIQGASQECRTDANGNFEFVGVAGAQVDVLWIDPRTRQGRSNGTYQGFRRDEPIPFDTSGLRIELPRRGALRLRVRDPDGGPVERYHVLDLALREESEMVVDEVRGHGGEHPDGEVVIPSLRGRHWLAVVPGGREDLAPAGYLPYTMPEHGALDLDVELPRAVRRRVVVADPRGDPVADSRVELIAVHGGDRDWNSAVPFDGRLMASHSGRPRIVASGTTGADGGVELVWRDVAADVLALRVIGPLHPQVVVPDLRWTGPATVSVAVRRGRTITGRVVPEGALDELTGIGSFDPQTRPTAAAYVLRLVLRPVDTAADVPGASLGHGGGAIRVAADGTFSIPSVPDGAWRVFGHVDSARPQLQHELAVWNVTADTAREPLELDLAALLPGRVEGVVSHPFDDARVTEIRVHVYADGSNYLHVVPADGPQFRFDGLRAGSEIELAATLQLADGRSLRFVDRDRFALAPSASVSRTLRIDRRVATIRLRDAAGSPLPTGHPVLIAHAAGTDLVATGAGGVVRLDPAPQDGVQLRVPKAAEHLERARAPLPDPDLVHVEQLAWPEAESSIDRSVTVPR